MPNHGVVEVNVPLPDDTSTTLEAYLETTARRERAVDAVSLRHVFAPESVVVVGASRRHGTVGRAILDNIRTAGYAGRLYAVNAHARQLGGVPCVPTLADLPEAPDLALIAVPAPGVPGPRRGLRQARRQGPYRDHSPALTPPPPLTCSPSADGTACGWSARTASA